MDTTFRDFISAQSIDWNHFPEADSLSLHNPVPKVRLTMKDDDKNKKKAVENEGFTKYQEYMVHVKCPEDVEAYEWKRRMRCRNLKLFKEEVEKLTVVTQKTVESIQLVIARQNSFIQSIDAMASNMNELIQTTRAMDYKSLKLDDAVQEENDVIVKTLESTTKACTDWFHASDFVPSHGGRNLDEEMEGILLQTRGLQELFVRRWEYLVFEVMRNNE